MSLCAMTSVKPLLHEAQSARWTIQGLSFINACGIESPVLLNIAGCKFGLRCKKARESSADAQQTVGLYVWYQGASSLMVKNMTIGILNEAGETALTRASPTIQYCKDSRFYDSSDAAGKASRNMGWELQQQELQGLNCVEADTLMVEISMIVSSLDTTVAHSIQGHDAAQEQCGKNAAFQLVSDIKGLLLEKKHADIVLRAADAEESASETFHAHRVILASRSPVFESMFFGGGSQIGQRSAGTEVQIDMTPDTTKAFLHAVYTDEILNEVWNDPEALCHLLQSFHRYQLKELTDRCEEQVLKQLTEENVAERLMMSDLLDMPKLRSGALDFIVKSPLRLANVQSTSGFSRLIDQRPRMLAEILSKSAPPRKREASPNELPKNLQALTAIQLKGLLSDRGLPTSGTKADLIDRLQRSSS
eukprot:TRINITY_DN17702_c0_g2_i1.p1 TRINITY_DN17702_c0_g2~~TRINITY_DN17702_c0_g2_i1.p1  ORF type:complete len:420 (-),score=59.82 TRINITY_DN17702_c0_g2_i1:195-1454(-)